MTQISLLRLLNNAEVRGPNVLSPQAAWTMFDTMCGDGRVRFAPEPPDLERHWREATRHHHTGPNFWTGAYLIAFAAATEMTLVTFDRALTRQRQARARLLEP